MNIIKKTLTIIIAAACIGWIYYRIKWNRLGLASSGSLMTNQTLQDNDHQNVGVIQEEIDQHGNHQVEQSYQQSAELRQQLLDKKIKATSVLTDDNLVPATMSFPKVSPPTKNNPRIQGRASQPDLSRKSSTVVESEEQITNFPDWFRGDQFPIGSKGQDKSVPTADHWGEP